MAETGPTPTMPYRHVYVDSDGVNRQLRFELSRSGLQGIGPDVAPQWNGKIQPSQAASPSPRCRSAGWANGTRTPGTIDRCTHRLEMGPGKLMMGEDQNATARHGRKWHLSGTIGSGPCTVIVTGLDLTPTVNQPGRSR